MRDKTLRECEAILKDLGFEVSLKFGCVDMSFDFKAGRARELGFTFPDEYLEGPYMLTGWFEMCQNLVRQGSEINTNIPGGWRTLMILGDFIEMPVCSRRKCMNMLVNKFTKQK